MQEFLQIHLQDGEVFSVHELENTSDVWGAKGLVASDLLVVAYEDNTIEIFDRITADSLKLIQELPNPFSEYQCEMITSAVTGDQFVLLSLLETPDFYGPVLFYLDEKTLDLEVRAQIRMPGPIEAACFSDEETVDIVKVADDQKSYIVTNLTLIDDKEYFLQQLKDE